MRKFIYNLRKRIKHCFAQLELIAPRFDKLSTTEFETTTYCNRKCEYCPNSNHLRVGDEDGKYMKEKTFEKLLNDLSKMRFRGVISPHFYGEPLTDPRLPRWISRIRQLIPECTIRVVTNGDFLDIKKYNTLIEAGTDIIECSQHSLQLPVAIVKLLNSLSEKERKKHIKILNWHKSYQGNQEMLNTRGGEVKLKQKKQKRHPVCCVYATFPVINTFGDVVLCCNDYHSKYVMGNIMERSLKEIWQDAKNIELRKRIYKGIFDLPICQNCWV